MPIVRSMKKDIWLISHSPRRAQLLRDLDLEFRIGEAHVEEVYPAGMSPEDIPVYLSKLKADAAEVPMTDDTLIITADTIVWAEGRVLGKPADAAEAYSMLRLLSGKTHQVITGVTLRSLDRSKSFYVKSDVTFRVLRDEDIHRYIRKCRPYDKAGAYGIQEWIGMVGVESVSGSFYNVMGLPTSRVYEEIREFL